MKKLAIILQNAGIEKIQISLGLLATNASMGGQSLLFLQDEALVTLLKNQWQTNSSSLFDPELKEKYEDSYETGLLVHPYEFLKKAKKMDSFEVYGCSTTCKMYHLLDSTKELDNILGLSSFLSRAKDFGIQII